jgi:hypothetical protein
MKRFICAIVGVLATLFGLMFAQGLTSTTSAATAQGYTYDSHHRGVAAPHTHSERAPPATYNRDISQDAVDRRPRGDSARPETVSTCACTNYDIPLSLAHRMGTTLEPARTTDGGPSWFQRSRVAAKSLSALEQGAAKVPGEWGPGLANRDLGGTRWFDPGAPKANGIRIDQGVPHSSFPSQQVDHVIVRSGGRILGLDGKPIVGSLKQNPDAHIPLSDWLNWTSWNAP